MTATTEHRLSAGPTEEPAARRRSRRAEFGIPLLAAAVGLIAAQPLADPDVWWHLRTGELIVEQGWVSRDPWSFASANPWQLHEWLSEVVMYAAYAAGGYAGVVALVFGIVAALVGVLAWSCRRVADPVSAYVVALVACVAIVQGLGARPQLVSWLLLAVVCPYLRSRVRDRRLPWALLPIIWIWANLHGLWVTAAALFAALVLGLAIEEGMPGWRTTARFSALGALAVVTAAATPNGPALLLAPLHVREYAKYVTEWVPPSITSPPTACALVLVLIVVLGWARHGGTVPASTVSFVVAATGLGLLYDRTVPVVAIAVAPLAAAALQQFTGPRTAPALRFDARLAGACCGVALLLVPALHVTWTRAAEVDPGRHLPSTTTPAILAATERVEAMPGRARLLNEYALGGWLLWAARDTSPGIDGRTEIYPVDHVEGYLAALAMKPGWREFIDDLDVDAALLLAQTPLADGLQSVGWTIEDEEDGLLVLLPPRGPND